MTILRTANAVQLISGKPQGAPKPRDVSSFSALFGGLTNSDELQITLPAGGILALRVTLEDLATLKGYKGGLGCNSRLNDGVDMCLSEDAGVFDGNIHRTSINAHDSVTLTLLPPNVSAGLAGKNFFVNIKRHDGKAGAVILQNHGPGAAALR